MLGPHTHRDNPLSWIMCAPIAPPVTVIVLHRKFDYFFVFLEFFFSIPKKVRAKMGKSDEKTNTGEGGKGKRGRTASDDAGGKSLSDTSTSAGEKSTVIHTSVNIFEVSKSDNPQYFVDMV